PRPPAGGQACLAGHRREPLRHTQGRTAPYTRGTATHLHPAEGAERHEPGRGNGVAHQPHGTDQEQRGIPHEYEPGVSSCELPVASCQLPEHSVSTQGTFDERRLPWQRDTIES